MKILIIYKSKTGFTKKYAEWIREETDAEIIPFKRKNKVSLNLYDTIIFGAPFHAGKISGLNWLKKKLPELKNKKIIVFATGASPAQDEEIKKAFFFSLPMPKLAELSKITGEYVKLRLERSFNTLDFYESITG